MISMVSGRKSTADRIRKFTTVSLHERSFKVGKQTKEVAAYCLALTEADFKGQTNSSKKVKTFDTISRARVNFSLFQSIIISVILTGYGSVMVPQLAGRCTDRSD